MRYDVVIIGAGVSGCAIARELSRLKMNIAVLEKAADVCEGTSKANSGIVHAGYDAIPGTLKAKLNKRGSEMMEDLSKQLDFSYRRNGSIVLCFHKEEEKGLEELLRRGMENGIPQLQILSGDEIRKIEPNISQEVVSALYAPTGGIVCPFGLNIALAENAADNGVSFFFEEEVTAIAKKEESYTVATTKNTYETALVINAAGVYADRIHKMVSRIPMKITPRKGEYLLFDKKVSGIVSHTIFQLPTKYGKGVLVTPTVHGNFLIGPTAEDVADKEETATTADGLNDVLKKAALSVKEIPVRQVITSFAGLRAHEEQDDFIIKECEDAAGFIDVAGIESPGLTCAPAIGEYVAELVKRLIPCQEKENFQETRTGIFCMAEATNEQKQQKIKENPAYANVICRCEMVTEGEIMDAIHRTLGATTTDGIKRRTRAGMGRCQSGFCAPKVLGILSRELDVPEEQITKMGDESVYLMGASTKGGSI